MCRLHLQGQEKLQLISPPVRAVLETDGTEVDDDILGEVRGEVLLLLLDNEEWMPATCNGLSSTVEADPPHVGMVPSAAADDTTASNTTAANTGNGMDDSHSALNQ